MSLLKKIRGDGAPLPLQSTIKSSVLAWLDGSLAIAVMMLTRTVHPPAGSNPVIFQLFPTLVGALIVVAVALICNNVTREAAYPKYG